MTAMNLVGNAFGLMWGSIFTNPWAAMGVNQLFMILFSMGAGMFANTGAGANKFIIGLSYVSPLHYGMTLLFRRVVANRNEFIHDELLKEFGFDESPTFCYCYLAGFWLLCVLIGLVSIYRQAKN